MPYDFNYPEERTNPDYKFDEIISSYNSNFSLISGGTDGRLFTGGTVDSIKVTGATDLSTTSVYILSADTIYSGSTNLYDIFLTTADGNDITRIQPGTNITTGGTDNFPTVNVANDIILNSISSTTISGGTLYSGSTNLYDIFGAGGSGDITRVQPGANIATGGTDNLPVISLENDITLNSATLSGLTVNGQSIFSGTGTDVVTIYGSGDTSPVFSIQGSAGELFAVTDSLSGSLFSVNDISGLPILEVFDDDTILMGSYAAPSLNSTAKVTANSGQTTVYSIPASAYTGAFFDYTLYNTTGARSGNVMAIWSGTSKVQFSESTTNDIGITTPVTFSVVISGTNILFRASANTNSWIVKSIVRSI